jgi:hypothetical protein
MSDTINTRQRQILELINKSDGLSRFEVRSRLGIDYLASTPTIARDLARLLKMGMVVVHGEGRNTRYSGINSNKLLRFFDLDKYLWSTQTKENMLKIINSDILDVLSGLYTHREQLELDKIYKISTQNQSQPIEIFTKRSERFIIELSWNLQK